MACKEMPDGRLRICGPMEVCEYGSNLKGTVTASTAPLKFVASFYFLQYPHLSMSIAPFSVAWDSLDLHCAQCSLDLGRVRPKLSHDHDHEPSFPHSNGSSFPFKLSSCLISVAPNVLTTANACHRSSCKGNSESLIPVTDFSISNTARCFPRSFLYRISRTMLLRRL